MKPGRICSSVVSRCAAALLTVVSLGLSEASWAEVPAAAEIEMQDQLGGAGAVAAYRGEPVVVMVVTASRLRNLKG